jgi:hypothetical protein
MGNHILGIKKLKEKEIVIKILSNTTSPKPTLSPLLLRNKAQTPKEQNCY